MLPIGVLALQGDIREHVEILHQIGVTAKLVKKPSDLDSISGLIIPGGESTVIDKLSKIFGLREPIRALIAMGLPVFGTCAGLIMLANELEDATASQESFGGLDVTVKRNAFGSQVNSFETNVEFADVGIVAAAFIRAPIITRVGHNVSVLATLANGDVVAAREGNLLGISFHPEIVGESRVHKYFVDLCKNADFKPAN